MTMCAALMLHLLQRDHVRCSVTQVNKTVDEGDWLRGSQSCEAYGMRPMYKKKRRKKSHDLKL